MDNPYQTPGARIVPLPSRRVQWLWFLIGVLLLLMAALVAVMFCSAAWYRLQNTEAMGRLPPPSIPLYVVDGFLIGALLTGALFVVGAIAAFFAAYARWYRATQE